MLRLALLFLLIALIAGALGLGGAVTGTALSIAQVLFYVFIVLFVLGLIFGGFRGRSV